LILLFTWSCKSDIDLTEDYKDIAIVYGILSQKDSVHYLRINKAFSGDNNAIEIAEYPDSSSYGSDIDVTIEEVTETGSSVIWHLDTITLSSKDTGTFYYPRQLFYTFNAILDPASTYNLHIKNKVNGNEVTAATRLIQDFIMTKPAPGVTIINFKKTLATQQRFEWLSAEYGKLHQLNVAFYFKETSSPGDTIIRKIEWPFTSVRSSSDDGGENLKVNYFNSDFYNICTERVPYSDAMKEEAVISRKPYHIDFVFTVITDDLCTYLDVNTPSSGVLLDKQAYSSNINNGLGVFSARYTKVFSYVFGTETQLYLWNLPGLKFVKPLG
jgi:hypothetical protein